MTAQKGEKGPHCGKEKPRNYPWLVSEISRSEIHRHVTEHIIFGNNFFLSCGCRCSYTRDFHNFRNEFLDALFNRESCDKCRKRYDRLICRKPELNRIKLDEVEIIILGSDCDRMCSASQLYTTAYAWVIFRFSKVIDLCLSPVEVSV